ncbi:MAG: acyl carrier protein [Clostridia bacterium]|nr:acyl carrier protein [Clostridia bacterium]
MLEKISEMIKEQLNLSGVEITEATSFKEDLGTDSLDLFELVMSMEEAFEVEIPTEDLEKMSTVGDIVTYLTNKGVEA